MAGRDDQQMKGRCQLNRAYLPARARARCLFHDVLRVQTSGGAEDADPAGPQSLSVPATTDRVDPDARQLVPGSPAR